RGDPRVAPRARPRGARRARARAREGALTGGVAGYRSRDGAQPALPARVRSADRVQVGRGGDGVLPRPRVQGVSALAEGLHEALERSGAGAQLFVREARERRLRGLRARVHLDAVRVDEEEARGDLAGLLALLEVRPRAHAVGRVVVLGDLAEADGAAVV